MFQDPHLKAIGDFLEQIGLTVKEGDVPEDSFLPNLIVRHGEIIVQPNGLHPGNLLHEAGHMAVRPPQERPTLHEDMDFGMGDETAATAWAFAVVTHLGIDAEVIFNTDSGFKDGAPKTLAHYKSGGTSGLSLLFAKGMTSIPGMPPLGPKGAAFPQMEYWLHP